MNAARVGARHILWPLESGYLIYKRERRVDRGHTLCLSLPPMRPPRRIRRQPRWQERLAKIRPIALPSPVIDTRSAAHGGVPPKTLRGFFSGHAPENSRARPSAKAGLQEWAPRGAPAPRSPPRPTPALVS